MLIHCKSIFVVPLSSAVWFALRINFLMYLNYHHGRSCRGAIRYQRDVAAEHMPVRNLSPALVSLSLLHSLCKLCPYTAHTNAFCNRVDRSQLTPNGHCVVVGIIQSHSPMSSLVNDIIVVLETVALWGVLNTSAWFLIVLHECFNTDISAASLPTLIHWVWTY